MSRGDTPVGYSWRRPRSGDGAVLGTLPILRRLGPLSQDSLPFKPDAERGKVHCAGSAERQHGRASSRLRRARRRRGRLGNRTDRDHDLSKSRDSTRSGRPRGQAKLSLVDSEVRGTAPSRRLERMAGLSPSRLLALKVRVRPCPRRNLDPTANTACHESRPRSSEAWVAQRRRGRRNPIGYLFSVTLAPATTSESSGEASANRPTRDLCGLRSLPFGSRGY